MTTDDAARLAKFYGIVFQEAPFVEGDHYSFKSISIWNPGDATVPPDKHIWLQLFDTDIDALYARLLSEIPGIVIISPPERKPWGAYSFWFQDPDGNKIAVAEERA